MWWPQCLYVMHIPCQAWRMERLRPSQFFLLLSWLFFLFIYLLSCLQRYSPSSFSLIQAIQAYTIVLSSKMSARPCVYFSTCLYYFPLPTETPTLGAHNLLLIQEFKASRFRLLWMGLCITEEIARLLYLCCPDTEKIECVRSLMKAIQKDVKRQRRKIRGKRDSTTLSYGLWMGVDKILIVRWMDEEKKVCKCCYLWNRVRIIG